MSQETAHILATVEAMLNGMSLILLLVGYFMARRRRIAAHRLCMMGALACTATFIVIYLTLHYSIGMTRFPELGWVKQTYLAILLTHTVLAAMVPFLIGVTVYMAARRNFRVHKAVARWTLPIWLYVSATGIIIYALLYHVAPAMTGS